MSRKASVLLVGGLLAAALFAMASGALSASLGASVSGSISLGGVDIYDFQCTSSQTHCMKLQLCHLGPPGSFDTWEMTLGLYSPLALIGQGDARQLSTSVVSCAAPIQVCRTGTTHGPMKGFVSVTHHPDGDGGSYRVNGECQDVDRRILPAANTKLIIKTDQ